MMRGVTVALTIIATFVYSYFEYKYSLGFIILATITAYLICQGFNLASTALLLANLAGHAFGRPFLTLLSTILLFVLLLFSYRPVVIKKTIYHDTKDYAIIEVPAKRRDGEDGTIIVEERLPNITEFHFERTREVEEISEPNEISDVLTRFSKAKNGSSKKYKEEPYSSSTSSSSVNKTKKSFNNKENQGSDVNQIQSPTVKSKSSSTSSRDIVDVAKREAQQAEEERKNKMIDEIYKSPSKDDKKKKKKSK
jgi:hypothetical protein